MNGEYIMSSHYHVSTMFVQWASEEAEFHYHVSFRATDKSMLHCLRPAKYLAADNVFLRLGSVTLTLYLLIN